LIVPSITYCTMHVDYDTERWSSIILSLTSYAYRSSILTSWCWHRHRYDHYDMNAPITASHRTSFPDVGRSSKTLYNKCRHVHLYKVIMSNTKKRIYW